MPRGLDGNPNPIRSTMRDTVLSRVVQRIRAVDAEFICVGIDGPAGSGKSTFADELAHVLQSHGVPTIRSTTDSFHNPRSIRYRRGRWSPEGYFRDSHNLEAIRTLLLEPFRAGQEFRTAAFDEAADQPLSVPPSKAHPGSVLLFDGLFLHRPELYAYWHYSVYLCANERLQHAVREMSSEAHDRYVRGWDLYMSECKPLTLASLVINNNDFAAPFVMGNDLV